MFNGRLTDVLRAPPQEVRQKKSRESGSQEFNREASNRVAPPLGKNPENWMTQVMTCKA
jgi:hypothetical protein